VTKHGKCLWTKVFEILLPDNNDRHTVSAPHLTISAYIRLGWKQQIHYLINQQYFNRTKRFRAEA